MVDLGSYKGKIVLLDFFASWCVPCQAMAPGLQAIHDKYRDRGLVVIGISMDQGSNAPAEVRAFIKEYGISYPVVIDTADVAKKFKVFSIPVSMLLDKNGKVVSKHMGAVPDLIGLINNEIEKLL